ncbi:MAG TPA: hypothetical protein VF796_08865, partial [Humisphaera sp.]
MSKHDEKLTEVTDLTNRLLDGGLDDVGRSRLNDLLHGDPGAAERYLNLVTLHAHLHRGTAAGAAAAVRAARQASPPVASTRRAYWRGWTPLRYAAAAAVLVGLGAVAARYLPARPSGPIAVAVPASRPAETRPDETLATVAAADPSAAWAGAPRAVGQRVAAGTVTLASGSATLRFDSGAVLTLYGPA